MSATRRLPFVGARPDDERSTIGQENAGPTRASQVHEGKV